MQYFWFAAGYLVPGTAVAQAFAKVQESYLVGPQPCAIVARDLNDDGLPEIVTADRGILADSSQERPANNELSLLVASDVLEYKRHTLNVGFGPYCVVVANLDAQKAPDLVVGSFHARRGRHVTLFRNLSAPAPGELSSRLVPVSFTVPTDRLKYRRMADSLGEPVFAPPGITSLTVGHFNGDAYRDVVATAWASDVLVFFPGHAEEYLGDPRYIDAPGGPRDVQAGDFDGDGDLDLATTLYAAGCVALWDNDGSGTFERVEQFASRGPLPHKLRASDLNGDGHLDLAVSHCHASDSIVLFFGGDGFRFSLSQEILFGDSRDIVEYEIRDILVEDLTGDGKPDIAAACHTSGEVLVLINTTPAGARDCVFRTEEYALDGRPYAICAADFDRDGKLDLGVTLCGPSANCVAILPGR
jgi:hypothetical protein